MKSVFIRYYTSRN